MRLRLLGTGTPTPSLKRMCSGYVVEIGDDVIVFDHGFGAHHRLLELGIPATRVTHFFCSHLHYDHMGDYPRLLLTRWDQGAGKIPELKVYGPPPIKQVTEPPVRARRRIRAGPDRAHGEPVQCRHLLGARRRGRAQKAAHPK